MMQKVEFCLLDIDYIVEGEKPIIRLFGKTLDGRRVVVLDYDFEPYFYVLPTESAEINKLVEKIKKIRLIDRKGREISPKRVEIVEKYHFRRKRKFVKIVAKVPQDVPKLRDAVKEWEEVENEYEYDIPYIRRYLIDKGIIPFKKIIVTGKEIEEHKFSADIVIEAQKLEQTNENADINWRVLAFDIEVLNPEGNVNAEKDPIIIISLATNDGLVKVLTYNPKIKESIDWVELLKSEEEIIKRFIKIVKEIDADIIVTYNGDQFDLPYIRQRAERYKIKLDLGIDGSSLRFVKRGRVSGARIKGRVHVDLYHFIFNIIRGTLRLGKFTLEELAKEILGEEKEDIVAEEIWKYWQEGGEKLYKLLSYAKSDAETTLKIANEILPLQIELCRQIHQCLFDISRMTSGQLVEWFLLRKAKEFGEVAPNRPKEEEKAEREQETYKGAFVLDPKKGLHENIIVYDFRSLYPSIIITFNIDPATINCECCNGYKSPVGYHFCKKIEGFIPLILKDLLEKRSKIKKEMKKLKKGSEEYRKKNIEQFSLKLLANSFYGYMGYAGSRWYCKECAEAITAYGRKYIKETIEAAKKFGFDVIYGDTDSLFVKYGAESLDKLRELAMKFLKEVNEKLPGALELELEGIYKRGLFIAKKKYALIDYNGNITTKGLELVRRDWAMIAKKTQQKVIETILKEGDVNKVAEIVRNTIENLRKGKVSIEDLVIYTTLKKEIREYKSEGPHVAVVRRAMAKGKKIKPGAIIGYVIVKGSGKISERARLVEEVKDGEYDPEYYIENQVMPPIERILEVLGLQKVELVGKGQAKLSFFFGNQ